MTLRRRRFCVALALLLPLAYLYWPRNATYNGGGRALDDGYRDVWNNTLGFSKIFVINRPSRVDRRDAMALAGAVSNLTFDWIDGVDGDSVSDRFLPPGNRDEKVRSAPARGSWRAHMNALQAVVDQNLGSALIMEDDVDWDVRLKSQLELFRIASIGWLEGAKTPRFPSADDNDNEGLLALLPKAGVRRRAGAVFRHETAEPVSVPLTELPTGQVPTNPYGDGWDVLWLGHCGSDFPKPRLPQLRVTIPRDPTVPAPKHLKPHPFALADPLGDAYPPHTRVVHAASGTVCTLAYAVSQDGARKLLWQFGVESFTKQWDLMLGDWCDGAYSGSNRTLGESDGAAEAGPAGRSSQGPMCVTVQPPLISHHYAKGGSSDIHGLGGGYATKVGTPYVRWSVRMNLADLVGHGDVDHLVDQWPDEGGTMW